ncbi:sarcosine oxidase subunit delta [Sphingobium sp.]|uniref:sarcosine oxidase subunit delta n=1 Tax=Sphingobium sp. TaxID=1912891 RepID=UPI003B3B1516
MLLIPCPYCGPRAEIEFHYGGPSHQERPAQTDATSDAEWAAYLFYRDNPKGAHLERWLHRHGCAMWFNLRRDTVSHVISGSYPMGSPPPVELSGAMDARHAAASRDATAR